MNSFTETDSADVVQSIENATDPLQHDVWSLDWIRNTVH